MATKVAKVTDPVCGMEIKPRRAAAHELYEGRLVYFCSPACHDAFLRDPHRYVHEAEQGTDT